MPPQFCPISFTLFPSIRKGGKTYSILMHIRENSDTSSGGIDHGRSSLLSCVPMTSIIRPHGCWLMHFRQVLLSSIPPAPPSAEMQPTPFIIPLLCSPPFPSSFPPLHHLCPSLCPLSHLSFPPPLLPSCFPNISLSLFIPLP